MQESFSDDINSQSYPSIMQHALIIFMLYLIAQHEILQILIPIFAKTYKEFDNHGGNSFATKDCSK